MKRKPRLFIASSVESLPVAEAINANLDHDLEVTLWKSGTFRLSSTTIEDLVKKSSAVDFALFIFTPDDISVIRNKAEHVVRDNVLFELGLFIGAIGKERCFIVKPRGIDLHLPTDILGGMSPADYESNRSDGDLQSALNRACTLAKAEIERKGLLESVASVTKQRVVVNPEVYDLLAADLQILAWAAQTYTSYPAGLAFHSLESSLRRVPDIEKTVGVIKLERLGYLERSIDTDQDGWDSYVYRITDNGISALLKHDPKLRSNVVPAADQKFEDDDIPF